MSVSQRTFALLLAMTPGVGGRSVVRVLARNGVLDRSPEDFFKLSAEALREEYLLSARASLMLAGGKRQMESVLEMERRLTGLGVGLVTSADAHYPKLVEEMASDPPGVLFLYGNTKLLEARTAAVMGSRGSSPADLDRMEKLAEAAVLDGEIIVAGHDRPEYQRTAIVPLRWGAPRVLCLDRGLFRVLGPDLKDEAFRAARLWRYQFDPETDLVVSPFRPDSDFVGINNKVRDLLVGCLARRIDLVHVGPGGNMARIGRLALKAGRAVRAPAGDALIDLGAVPLPAD